jgi:hypothetical protein
LQQRASTSRLHKVPVLWIGLKGSFHQDTIATNSECLNSQKAGFFADSDRMGEKGTSCTDAMADRNVYTPTPGRQ